MHRLAIWQCYIMFAYCTLNSELIQSSPPPLSVTIIYIIFFFLQKDKGTAKIAAVDPLIWRALRQIARAPRQIAAVPRSISSPVVYVVMILNAYILLFKLNSLTCILLRYLI